MNRPLSTVDRPARPSGWPAPVALLGWSAIPLAAGAHEPGTGDLLYLLRLAPAGTSP